MSFHISNTAGHLRTILSHSAPGSVESLRAKSEKKEKSIEDILKKESDRIDRIVKRSASLQTVAFEHAEKEKANSKPSRSNMISMGGWGTTLVGQCTALAVGWSNSSVISKIMQGFTIGSTITTAVITGFVYWKHFRQKNLVKNRAEEVEQLGDIETKFHFILESKLLADSCLNPISASCVKHEYYSLKGKINHDLRTSDVTKQFCSAWIEAEPLIKELSGEGKSQKLQTFVNERIMKIIRDLAKENEEFLNTFRELGKQEADLDHSSEAIERLEKLIDETITLREAKEKKVASAEGSTLNTIYSHYAPVGTWIITIGGQVAAIVEDWGSSTPGTKVIEFATVSAAALTGVITGAVYVRYFRKEDIHNLGGVINAKNSAEIVKKDSATAHAYAQFLEQAHTLGENFVKEGYDQKQLKHDYKQLREFMTHHKNSEAIPNHLYNQWIALGRHILSEEPFSFNEEINAMEIEEKKDENILDDEEVLEQHEPFSTRIIQQTWSENTLQNKALDRLLPRIHHAAKHFDEYLSKIKWEESQESGGWWRSCRPFRWIRRNAEKPSDIP